ncbi:SDR family oxidoreductase [Rhodocaloribacter litoris]|uniref:SDR family oxidoreductase n=1 Tax=Rhodocaloribacter litoris TaxID=2558931 RepID=UPI0014231989|nr:SDR family oxidoreductase [Rhodocaloribacter litoris]QXD15700.1 SDR family oxidoreductase [Rhodocaloribacter litoris]
MDLSLHGRRAMVCGSTQGIGRACAETLARLGASVTLVARNERRLAEVMQALPAGNGQEHDLVPADFEKPGELAWALRAYAAGDPPVHILVNNTGGPPGGPLIEASLEALNRAFAMHVLCNQVLVQAVIPSMKAARYGRIINIVSTSVRQPIPGLGVSNTVRGAVASWAKTLAGELGPFGITVNNVLPGATETGRLQALIAAKAEQSGQSPEEVAEALRQAIPARRFARPEEIAWAVAFLASPAAAYINGINLPVDGGRTQCL